MFSSNWWQQESISMWHQLIDLNMMLVPSSSLSVSPVFRKSRPKQSSTPIPYWSPQVTDRWRTRPPLPESVERNIIYVYIHALHSNPPLISSICSFLDKYHYLFPDYETKRRLAKLPSDWDHSIATREAPPDLKLKKVLSLYNNATIESGQNHNIII